MFYRAFRELSGAVPTGVLILCGQTASGKSALALDLAKRFDAEIVNADSRQVYRGMEIGTAQPTREQLAAVPHHLYGFIDPYERYSAGRFTSDAIEAITEIHARGRRAIVVGGTGFYVRALTGDVQLARAYDPGLRARLAHEARIHETAFLHEWLKVRDPARAQSVMPTDVYRILRALEIALSRHASHSDDVQHVTLGDMDVPFLKVAIEINEDELDRRIARRVDAMLSGGLLDEAERIGPQAVAADAVGYRQALAFLSGECTMGELKRILFRATRRYAKRQATWLRSEPQIVFARARDVERLARENIGWD